MNRAVISDGLNLLSKINIRRVTNLISLYFSFHFSRLTGKPYHRGNPYTISIEPTTSCNLRCPECPSGLRKFSRPTGSLTIETFKSIIDQLHKDLFYLLLYFQGEPYLNPLFFRFVEYATKKKIYVSTSTNAHYLNDVFARKTVECGLDRLIISLDGTTQETYEKYRVGGSLEKVLEGVKNLRHWKNELHSRKPHIVLQFIVFRTNEHQIAEVRKLASELGVDELQLKSAQVYNYESGNPLIPEREEYSRYKSIEGTDNYKIDNPLRNRCWRMWRGCVITWDGLVVPCCFDKDADHKMGDLKKEPFQNIWRGPLYDDFRKKLMASRKDIEICRNCTEK
jgi:radical SAM protein with 4Fe4S-binding SPASM domain